MVRKKPRKKYPLFSSPFQLRTSVRIANRKIRNNLSPMEFGQLNTIIKRANRGDTSLRRNSRGRVLIPKRQRFHNRIITNHFRDRSTIDRKDPDLYVLGGIAGSGKTEVLINKIPEKTINIDNDTFKKRLSKHTPSPIPRLPLAHAPLLHDEAKLLVERSIDKARRESRDVTLDKTFRTFEKGQRTIQKFKDEGYDIHFLGTQKQPHQTIENTATRFVKKGKEGRYVPPEVIAQSGNQTSRNVLRARELVDSHQIHDTTVKGDPVLVFKSKRDLTHNFRDPDKN